MATETTFWDMDDKRPEKVIYIPTSSEKTFDETILDRYNSTNQLQEEAYKLRDTLKKYKLIAIDKNGQKYEPEPIKLMYSNQKKLKKDYVTFIAIIRNSKNFFLFYNEWSERMQKLFKKILLEHYVFNEEATKILGETYIKKSSSYYWEAPTVNEKLINWVSTGIAKAPISRKKAYDQRDYYLYLNSTSKYTELLPKIFPEKMKLEKLEELPHAESYKTYCGEANIFTAFPIMSSLFDSDQLNIGRNKLPASDQKKAAKLINLPEFFNDGNKYFSNLCASMVLNIYTIYCNNLYNNDLDKTQVLLKDIFKNLDECQEYLLPILMPHFTGFRKTICECCSCGSTILNIQAVLRELHTYRWIPVETLNMYCRLNAEYAEDNYLMFYTSDLEKVTLHNEYDGKDVYLSNLLEEITRPYIKAVLFMMAAFGFVEIAYREKPAEGATSYYDGLEYVRLTNLGLYALGIKRKYIRTQQDDIKYFELDTERLIIKSLIDNNPYESLLGNMATAISKRMYKVSYESFLNGCNKLQDINSKIDFFKNYICKELPDNWEQFFKEIKNRCKPLKAPQKKYSLLQLPSDNRELQRIILTDPTIHKYTLKAEGFILLIETSNKGKVTDALKKYGYVI